jgi:AP-1 complex subunit gamma-1
MPPPQIKEESRVLGEASKKLKKAASRKSAVVKMSDQDLLDLMGENDSSSANLNSAMNGSQNNASLLADILGGSVSPQPQVASPTPLPQQSNLNSIMDLFGPSSPSGPSHRSATSADPLTSMFSPSPPAASVPAGTPTYPCYSKNDLTVTLQLQRNAEGTVLVLARFTNTSLSTPKTSVGLQAAVPKTQKLQLNAISNADLGPSAEATQTMRVSGSKGVSHFFCVILP